MLGDDGSTADEVDAVVEANARGRRLGHAADHGRVGEAVDDGVADHMHPLALAVLDDPSQAIEVEAIGLHQKQQLLERNVRRLGLDQVRGRVDDVARCEQDFAAIGLQDFDLLLGLGIDARLGVLVALGEIVGLDARDVVDRRGIEIDEDEIDHFERRKIECAQLLGHEWPVLRLRDVRIGGEARDQDIGLLLGVEQMADVTGVHEVEHAVAHDDLLGARARSDGSTELINSLDLAPIVPSNRLQHVSTPCSRLRTRFSSPA